MRKHITPVCLGFFFLMFLGGCIPVSVEAAYDVLRFSPAAAWLSVLMCATLLTQRKTLQELAAPALPFFMEAVITCQLVAGILGLAFPNAVDSALVIAKTTEFSNALMGVVIYPSLVAVLAFLIAPSSGFNVQERRLEYLDRTMASKFFLGAAGITLLFRLSRLFW